MDIKKGYKETEIGVIPEEWEEVVLEDAIQINPRERLKKGTLAKKVGMDKLEPYTRKIQGFDIKEYKSGSKFRNGDTLLARITPCLENGKTAKVDILDDDEIGFGSTEFIVMREKEEKTINDYIYYLAISPRFREIAIKSMTGTSGRQRVQKDVLKKTKIKIPPLNEQKAIADILSSLDDKIEVNNQINKTLEEISQAIFKHWFIDFEFPNEEGKPYKSSGGEMIESELGLIPKGWEVKELTEVGFLTMGLSPKSNTYNTERKGIPLLNGAADFENGLIKPKKYTVDPKRTCGIGDLVFCIRGTIGNITFADAEYCLGRGVASIKSKSKKFKGLIYFNILDSMNKLIANASGSVILGLTKSDIEKIKILLPTKYILNEFYIVTNLVFKKISMMRIENQVLSQIRDTLLPKLMSGEIRVV